MNGSATELERLLEEAAAFHGHLCAGQVLGVRMALLGLKELGIRDPRGEDRKRLIVFVEIDRCATDAIMTVTVCTPGKRSMKILPYGKMAATFVKADTGKGVRIVSREDSRERAMRYAPGLDDLSKAQKEAYKIMPDCELFDMQEVLVQIKPEDMPGKPLRRVVCSNCGESVMDIKEVYRNGRPLCWPCSSGAFYYEPLTKGCPVEKAECWKQCTNWK